MSKRSDSTRFAANLVDYWRKWYSGEPVGDSVEWMHLVRVSKTDATETLELIAATVEVDEHGETFHCLSDVVTDLLQAPHEQTISHVEAAARANPAYAIMLSLVHLPKIPAPFRERISAVAISAPEDDDA